MPATSRSARSSCVRSAIGRSGSPSKSRSTHPGSAPAAPGRGGSRRGCAEARGHSICSARSYTASMAARRSAIAGHLGDRDREAPPPRRRGGRAIRVLARPGREELGEREVDLGGRRSERAGLIAEVLRMRGRAQRDAPRVLDVRKELLRRPRAIRTRCPAPSTRSGHSPSIQPIVAGTCGDPASPSAVGSSMSGLKPGCSCR